MQTQSVFKPFLVKSNEANGNIFEVVELNGRVRREQVEQLLEQWPMGFQVQKDLSPFAETINEPLQVYVTEGIVYIFPPKGRVIARSFLWKLAPELRNMNVDNLTDVTFPGNGQIRSCIHF